MITRDVAASAVADLAFSPGRAALASTAGDEILLMPVALAVDETGDPALSPRIVRVPDGTPDLAGRNVVVIADDGPQWFRLRSLTVRGTAEAMAGGAYRVAPKRVVAWDYGSLRPAPAAPGPARQPVFSVPDEGDDLQPFDSPTLQAAVRTSRVMILASRSRQGTPFAVPLWFVVDRGRLYAATSASSWTVRNVAESPRVALLLGGERRGTADRFLVRAHARSVRGFPPPAVLAQTVWRYYLHPRFVGVELGYIRLWPRRMQYYSQAQAAHIVMTPLSVLRCQAPPPLRPE